MYKLINLVPPPFLWVMRLGQPQTHNGGQAPPVQPPKKAKQDTDQNSNVLVLMVGALQGWGYNYSKHKKFMIIGTIECFCWGRENESMQ